MKGTIINRADLNEIEKYALDEAGKLIIKPAAFWAETDRQARMFFMHKHAIYVLPTSELIEWLRCKIIGHAIEIGAGNGAIGRALNIPITDSKLQETQAVKEHYNLLGTPLIKYPDDVIKLDAISAIYKYKPQTVIGAFITHKWVNNIIQGNYWGVQEEKILKLSKRYLNIGNLDTHKLKPILKRHHEEHNFPWLITRSVDQSLNRIFEFNG